MNNNDSKKSDSEKIIYSVVGAVIICNFIPAYIPYCVVGGVLLGSLYGIADIISKSDYANSKYVSKENVKYFDDNK